MVAKLDEILSTTPGRRQSKKPILSRIIDKKSIETEFLIGICRPTGDKWQLETEFLIGICRPTGDKWQSKTLFLSIFDPRSLFVDYIFDCLLPCVATAYCFYFSYKLLRLSVEAFSILQLPPESSCSCIKLWKKTNIFTF